MRRRVLTLASLTVGVRSYVPASRSTPLTRLSQLATCDDDETIMASSSRRRARLLQSAEPFDCESRLLDGVNVSSSQSVMLVPSDELLVASGPGNATVSNDVTESSNPDHRRGLATNELPRCGHRWSTLTRRRFREAMPKLGGDELDRVVLSTAIPSMINLAVVPIVNSVDTFFVGRLGSALALAGQAAANQAFFTLFFLINYLPTITAPLVAAAVGSGDPEEAQQRVCESLFLGNVLGLLGTILLSAFPGLGLSLILSKEAPALAYAIPYLRFRSLSMVPAIVSATGFAAYRGMLNTVTPLKVSLAANLINLILDPLLIFQGRMGFTGAALATAVAETVSGLTYLRLLLRNKLVSLRMLTCVPSVSSLLPLLLGGMSMLLRQAALNVGIVVSTRRAQSIDPTGVAAAAYGIVMQIYTVGIVVHVAMQATAATLVPSAMAREGTEAARKVADRMFAWGSLVGLTLGIIQLVAVPRLVPLFSTLPSVQEAARVPALLASILHIINGPVFAGEGVMLGLGKYTDLMLITAFSISTMVAGIWLPMGRRLEGILLATMVFCAVQAIAVVLHYLFLSPLAVKSSSFEALDRKAGIVSA